MFFRDENKKRKACVLKSILTITPKVFTCEFTSQIRQSLCNLESVNIGGREGKFLQYFTTGFPLQLKYGTKLLVDLDYQRFNTQRR